MVKIVFDSVRFFTPLCYCDKSVNKERGIGTGDEEPERGTRNRNGGRGLGTRHEKPYGPNNVTGRGNEDPPCMDMGGTSDPISRCIIIGN